MSTEEAASPLTAEEIAQRLKEARAAAGLTQRALAQRAHVSASLSIHELERAEAHTRLRNAVTLARLALALNQPWDYLGAAPPPDLPPGPGRQLCQARLARGWTIRQLDAVSGVNQAAINRMEHGTQGSRAAWRALATALDLPLAEFGVI